MGVAIYNSRNSKVGIDITEGKITSEIYNSRNSKVGIDIHTCFYRTVRSTIVEIQK